MSLSSRASSQFVSASSFVSNAFDSITRAASSVTASTFTSASTSSTTTQSNSTTTKAKPHANAGRIAGEVIGAVVFVALIVALCWWWSCRRKTRRGATTHAPIDGETNRTDEEANIDTRLPTLQKNLSKLGLGASSQPPTQTALAVNKTDAHAVDNQEKDIDTK